MAINPHRTVKGIMLMGMLLSHLFIPGAADVYGQRSPFDPAFGGEAAKIVEEITCFTDRSMYIAGEPVRFSAWLQGSQQAPGRNWSRVIYGELVSAEGRAMAWAKFPVVNSKAGGEILIPPDVISGVYFLRIYTRWMRNRGPGTYGYVPLRIINPYRDEVQERVAPDEEANGVVAFPAQNSPPEIQTGSPVFERGEQISLQLPRPLAGMEGSLTGCLTVVAHSARPVDQLRKQELMQGASGEDSLRAFPGNASEDFQLGFLPDKFGPTISGRVILPDGGEGGRSEIRIHFTLMGENKGYLVCRSDASGRFAVALPCHSGKLELFVQPESLDGKEVEVRIDRDFDQRHLKIPVSSFRLDDRDRRWATLMARNLQLTAMYEKNSGGTELDSVAWAYPFYGRPALSVDLDRFVLLPTLDEVFVNLVPGVSPVSRGKRISLQIYSENPALSMFAPLVMVDQVPVFDMDKFMSISPAKIRRIDVIEDVYVKGDLRFGGLINLQTRERDMAGMDIPENSFFIDYLAMQPPVHSEPSAIEGNDRMPDTRNTLLWLPDVSWDETEPLGISFMSPDYPGEYVVVFRGLDREGELVVAETTFMVK